MSNMVERTELGAERRIFDKQDFSAVILVGQGDNLYPFNQGTNVLPKALMPVGNVPMINIVLDWVFAAGITDILIVVPPSATASVSEYLQQEYSSASHPHAAITLKSYADEEDDDDEDEDPSDTAGTARLLRRFRSHIKTDFVLLPCDISFPSTLTLASVLDQHRATPDAVLTSVFYEPTESVAESEEKMLVGLDREARELLFVDSLETLEDSLSLRMGLLESHPTLALTTRLLDAHVYVLRRTVLDLLATRASKELSSVREQFVPWLVKGAWQEGLGSKWSQILSPPRRDPFAEALARSTSTSHQQAALLTPPSPPSSAGSEPTPLPSTPQASEGEQLAAFKSAVARSGKSVRRRTPQAAGWTCRVIVAKPEAVPEPAAPTKGKGGGAKTPAPEPEHLIRANSIAGYWEINRRVVRSLGAAHAAAASAAGRSGNTPSPSPSAAGGAPVAAEDIAASAQISPDSIVGDGVRVGERASIKKCIVGRHCNIGRGAKLTGCVLWDFVTVEENARLENVVCAQHVRIGEKAQIKDCEFGPGFEASPGVQLRGERLVAGQEA